MEVKLIKVSCDDFEYSLDFSVTRYVFGFSFNTPNYCTGYYKNPFTALSMFMKFCCKRDLKITKAGG